MIENQNDTTIVEALLTAWIQVYGPMKALIIESDSDVVNSHTLRTELKARGIELKPRTQQPHATYIQRRGALLRQVLCVTEERLKREGIVVSFPMLLAEIVFAGNCLTHVNGVTPYQVVYGRQPSLMPPMVVNTEELDHEGVPNDRLEARTREVALQTMIEISSQVRIHRTERTHSYHEPFELGDQVEYRKMTVGKNASGWHGPAVITEVIAEQEQVVFRHHGEEIRCNANNIRKFIGLGLIIPELQFASTNHAFKEIRRHIETWTLGVDQVCTTC